MDIYTPKNARVVYVPYYIREYIRSIQPSILKHPKTTKQGYDFFYNLDMFCGRGD